MDFGPGKLYINGEGPFYHNGGSMVYRVCPWLKVPNPEVITLKAVQCGYSQVFIDLMAVIEARHDLEEVVIAEHSLSIFDNLGRAEELFMRVPEEIKNLLAPKRRK